MSRTLFIGDSHSCGYDSIPGKVGPGSYTYWNNNNYGEIYGKLNSKPVAIYAMAGVNNRVYTDWLASMFSRFDDIEEVYICMAPLIRFCIGFDDLSDDVVPVDHFTLKVESSTDMIQRFCDHTVKDDKVQLFNKPTQEDFSKFPGIELSAQQGLISPDLRKHTFMQIKMFFEMNTFLEKRDFLNCIYSWDNMCHDHGSKLYLFNVTDRLKFPANMEYYGKLKNTTVAPKTIETYFREKRIDHTKYLLADKEHYNREFHTLIADKYLPWLKSL
jgi:hypothetical protein